MIRILAIASLLLSVAACAQDLRSPGSEEEAPAVEALPPPEQERPLRPDACEEIGPARPNPHANARPGVQCPRAQYPRVPPQVEVTPQPQE
jgi:hypothetical protein